MDTQDWKQAEKDELVASCAWEQRDCRPNGLVVVQVPNRAIAIAAYLHDVYAPDNPSPGLRAVLVQAQEGPSAFWGSNRVEQHLLEHCKRISIADHVVALHTPPSLTAIAAFVSADYRATGAKPNGMNKDLGQEGGGGEALIREKKYSKVLDR